MSWTSTFVGIPFDSGGRDPARALDCWGLVLAVFKTELGIDLPDYTTAYCDALESGRVAALISGELAPWHPVAPADRREFDGVLMRPRGSPHAAHVGLVSHSGAAVLHAERGAGVIVQRWCDLASTRVIGVYRHERLCNR